MSAFTTRMLPWCYLQEELPTTAATDAPQLLVSGLLQLPTATSSSSVGLKIYKQCVSFLNSVHLFRHTETASAELSQSWKWVTHPLLSSSPPRTAGSRACHHMDGLTLLQSRNKSQTWCSVEMSRVVRAPLDTQPGTASPAKRFAASSPLFISQYPA